MKLPEAINDNIKSVRDALNLIESDVEKSDVTEMVLDSLSHQERVELAKGSFLAVRLLFSSLSRNPDAPAIRQLASSAKRYKHTKQKDRNGSTDTLTNILLSMEEDGGSFYLQLYTLRDPAEVTVQLVHIFEQVAHKFYGTDFKKDSLKALAHFKRYISEIENERNQRDREQAGLVKLMRKESAATENALRVMEILSTYFVADHTEDKEEVYYLKEESLYAKEVVEVARVPDQVELLKGVCIVSCVFLSMYLTVGSIIPIIDERRAQLMTDTPMDDDAEDDIQTQHLALNLMNNIALLDEEEYYREVAAMDDIYGVIMSLNTSIYRTTHAGLNRTTKDIAASLRKLLNDKE